MGKNEGEIVTESSLDIVKEQVTAFLKRSKPEVLCISGAWGVGKTHLWQEELLPDNIGSIQNSKYANISWKNCWKLLPLLWNILRNAENTKYAYVSLFGINSLDDLKYKVVANAKNSSDVAWLIYSIIGIFGGILIAFPNSFSEVFLYILGFIGFLIFLHFLSNFLLLFFRYTANGQMDNILLTVISNFFTKKVSSYVDVGVIGFTHIKDAIICIDDIERKGEDLCIKDVFGLISELKEQKNCKVVILLNDAELKTDDDKKEFDQYFEKTVDIALRLNITPTEACEIALEKLKKEDEKLFNLIKKHCNILKIDNIRVIRKIAHHTKQVLEIETVQEFNFWVQKAIVNRITFLSWCFYKFGSEITRDYLMNTASPRISVQASPTEKQRQDIATKDRDYKLLSQPSFYKRLELDYQLLDCIENGYCNKSIVIDICRDSDARRSFEKVRELVDFHCFDNNEEEIVTGFIQAFKNYGDKYVSDNLSIAATILKKIGRIDDMNDLIEIYKEKNKNKGLEFWQCYRSESNEAQELFDEMAASKQESKPLLFGLATNNYHTSDIKYKYAAELDVEDYLAFFKELKGENQRETIIKFLNYDTRDAPDPHIKIAQLTKAALIEIGRGSLLNKYRIETLYQIEIPPSTEENPA